MKKNLTALDIMYVVKELQCLLDAKFDKIYDFCNGQFVFSLHIPNLGKKQLFADVKGLMFLTERKFSFPEKPSGLCMFLRKHLSNARIRSVTQLGFERIVEFVVEKKEGKVSLVIELFGGGNLLMLKDGVITTALNHETFKDRIIRPGVEYKWPAKKYNFKEISKDELRKMLKDSDKENSVKALALDLGLGGLYAEELCLLSGIDKDSLSSKVTDIKKLHDSIMMLKDKEIDAFIVEDEDVVPFELQQYKDKSRIRYSDFNSALDAFFSGIMLESEKKQEVKESSKDIMKAKRIITEQEEKISEMKKQEEEERLKGEMIYNNYQQVSEILAEISKARKKFSFKEIKAKLKGHGVVREVDEKDKSIVVEL